MSTESELSKTTLRTLTEITGETRLDLAVTSTLKDALEHRIEIVERGLKEFEKKYGMKFPEFEEKWDKDKIKNKHSYHVEKDYIEWETLATRYKKLKGASKWIR